MTDFFHLVQYFLSLLICSLYHYFILFRIKKYSIVVLICNFLIANDKHLFMCLLAICLYFLNTHQFRPLTDVDDDDGIGNWIQDLQRVPSELLQSWFWWPFVFSMFLWSKRESGVQMYHYADVVFYRAFKYLNNSNSFHFSTILKHFMFEKMW